MTNGNLTWDKLFFAGSIVDLDVTIWSARIGITPQDLGIENTTDVRTALSLGCHRLLPREAFREIGDLAREAKRVVEDHSVNFTFIRGARYIPAPKVESLLTRLATFRTLFDIAVEKFSLNYAKATREMKPVIREALSRAAHTEDAAEEAYARICKEYPEEVSSLFSFGWKVYAISGAKSGEIAGVVDAEVASVKSVVSDMVRQLRQEFAEKVQIISNSVSRGGKLKGNTIASTRETLEKVESLNVFGDEELNRQIRALRVVLDKASVVENTKELGIGADLDRIKATLDTSIEEAIAAAEKTLTGLGQRKIQIPEGVK